MDAIKTIQYKKHVINFFQDENYERMDNEDNDVFLLYYHRDFFITREGFPEPREFQTIKEWANDYHMFTVYAYIHSGVALSLSNEVYPFDDKWDVSNCGFAMIKKDSGIENPREAAQSLIDEYNDILSGNVYGYQISFNDEITESCWGFVGDIDKSGIIDEAKAIVDSCIEINKEKFATQKELEFDIKGEVKESDFSEEELN
jgi:hypothetical protein